MNSSTKGKIAELYAINYFMEKGYHVALSVDPSCPFDLVITDKQGACTLVDVKNLRVRKQKSGKDKIGDRIGRGVSSKQKIMGIELFEIDISSCKNNYKVYNKRIT